MKALCRALSVVVALVTMTPTLIALPAGAAAKQKVSVAIQKSSVLTSQTVHITGKVAPAASGKPIRLQRYYGRAWHGYKQTALTKKSSYDFGVKFSVAGSYKFRVAGSSAVSKPVTLRVVARRATPPRAPISPV
jgi:hypothetical protein